MITSTLEFFLRLSVWLLAAPLFPGIINKVKAWVAGRAGRPSSSSTSTWPDCGGRASS
jgi:formate hydrogenlyase subunit 4